MECVQKKPYEIVNLSLPLYSLYTKLGFDALVNLFCIIPVNGTDGCYFIMMADCSKLQPVVRSN